MQVTCISLVNIHHVSWAIVQQLLKHLEHLCPSALMVFNEKSTGFQPVPLSEWKLMFCYLYLLELLHPTSPPQQPGFYNSEEYELTVNYKNAILIICPHLMISQAISQF
uniref:Uncharacterized protein n=1 Tax=Sphaerodactylus townsendi TaxID=933632 RepID=A0ACB8G2D2_9SAUR